jgi:hypothetical protein
VRETQRLAACNERERERGSRRETAARRERERHEAGPQETGEWRGQRVVGVRSWGLVQMKV